MGLSTEYQATADWQYKAEGYETGAKVKYKGNIFVADFWAQSEPGKKPKPQEGWALHDELYDKTPKQQQNKLKNGTLDSKSLSDINAILSDVKLAAKSFGVKVMIALGGATDYAFLDIMTKVGKNNVDLLEKGAQTVVKFVREKEIDGVDLDLECWWDAGGDPSKDQGGRSRQDGPHLAGKGLRLFAKRLRELLPKKTISAAVFGTSWYGNNYDSEMHPYLDWIGIMSYDLTGSWNASPVGPHTALHKIRDQSIYEPEQYGKWPGNGMADNPIFTVEDSLWYWTNPFYVNWQGKGAAVPRSKIVLGVPTYGYDFAYAKDTDDLSGQVPPGYKVIRYKDILAQHPGASIIANANIKVAGSARRPSFVDASGEYPYSHNIYYETPETANAKLQFAKDVGCQGVLVWELTNASSDNNSIIDRLFQRSGNETSMREFKNLLRETTQILTLIGTDQAMKAVYGFTIAEYLQLLHDASSSLQITAKHIEKVTSDTGIAHVVGGSTGILSGLAIIGGILLAPFSGGASMGLTALGVAGGVASAATTLSAKIVKDVHVRESGAKVKSALDDLEPWDKVIIELMKRLGGNLSRVQDLQSVEIKAWLADPEKIAKWSKTVVWNIGYGSYKALNHVLTAAQYAKFASVLAGQFKSVAAANFAAPGLSIAKTALVVAGTTTAKILQGTFAVLGIGFGIWDIVDGAADIEGSDHSKAYREAAHKINDRVHQIRELLSGLN